MYCPKACLLLPESLINKSILIVCLVLSGSKNGGGGCDSPCPEKFRK